MSETPTLAVAEKSGSFPARRGRRPWVLGVGLVLAGMAGFLGWQQVRMAPSETPAPVAASLPSPALPSPALTVSAEPAALRPMARVIVGDGSIVPWQELVIGAETGGLRVVEMAVEEGDHVRAGQVLARMEDAVPAAQLAQAEAAVTEAEAALEIARAELRRAVELARSQNTPRQTLEQRQSTARQAEARLAATRASRDEAAARLEQTRLRAPTDGIVLRRSALLGSVVSLGQEMVRLLRDGQLELDARVPELDLAAVAPGQPVQVSHGSHVVVGKVRAIAPVVAPETRLGTAHITLPADSGLRPGMFARAEIQADAAPVLTVPQEAVLFRDGGPAAFVLQGDRVVLRALTTGMRRDGWVEVTSGLDAGERVVTRGGGFLADGDRVRLAESR